MRWLPSFVQLFLFFVAGMVMFVGGAFWWIKFLMWGKHSVSGLFRLLQLGGWWLMVGSALLIALKFFARLDRNPK